MCISPWLMAVVQQPTAAAAHKSRFQTPIDAFANAFWQDCRILQSVSNRNANLYNMRIRWASRNLLCQCTGNTRQIHMLSMSVVQ